MESKQINIDNYHNQVNGNEKLNDNIDNLNYLYPNGHRITHQMRWIKGSRDIAGNSNISA